MKIIIPFNILFYFTPKSTLLITNSEYLLSFEICSNKYITVCIIIARR